MNDPRRTDEMILIDYLLGRCDADESRRLEDRIQRDESFRRLHEDLVNTFAALRLSPEPQASDGLVEATMASVRSAQRTEALIAKEQLSRPAIRPTFSMRELTVAAAAVLVLAIILVPSIRQSRQLARVHECAGRAGQIGTALGTYASANEGYLPAVDASSPRWLPVRNNPAVSNSAALFKLIHGRYAASPVLFQCPAVGGSSFEVRASMTDFPADKYIGYSYQHTMGKYGLRRTDPALEAVTETMAILADSSPIFVGGMFHRERLNGRNSRNHNGTGQNVLYLDMHVEWAKAPTVGVDGDNIYLARGVLEYEGEETPAEPTDSFLLPSYSPAKSPPR